MVTSCGLAVRRGLRSPLQMLRRIAGRTPLGDKTNSSATQEPSNASEMVARSEVDKLRELNRILIDRIRDMKSAVEIAKSPASAHMATSPMVLQTPITGTSSREEAGDVIGVALC